MITPPLPPKQCWNFFESLLRYSESLFNKKNKTKNFRCRLLSVCLSACLFFCLSGCWWSVWCMSDSGNAEIYLIYK